MQFCGRNWNYQYRELFNMFPEERFTKVIDNITRQYAKLTKNWTSDKNSEWCCRIYFSTKMILNATVLLKSLEFAESSGMRIANPYFRYYAVFSLLRGLLCTIPTEEWNNGKLISVSHNRAINVAFNWLAMFDTTTADDMKSVVLLMKAERELIAYKAPASGDLNLNSDFDFDFELKNILTILAEVAQFNSEILESSVTKNADPSSFHVCSEYIRQLTEINIDGFQFSDLEDRYRLSYVERKIRRPYNIRLFMREGQTEDFIGAWDGDEESEESFTNGSPCQWQLIFDIP